MPQDQQGFSCTIRPNGGQIAGGIVCILFMMIFIIYGSIKRYCIYKDENQYGALLK